MTQPSVDDEIAALRAALYLAAIPSRCAQLRSAPLPDGVGVLLRIVANEGDAMESYAARLEKSSAELREAAAFYIEQVMLAPGVDSYRVLGTQRHAQPAELRRNLVLLCRWLHSGICEDLLQSVFFLRVTQAWNDLKTPERRAAYDAALRAGIASPASKKIGGGKSTRRNAMDHASQEAEVGKKVRKRKIVDLRRSQPKGLWRFIMFGRGRRAR